jgi:uncharacterized membrane protein YeaQ/YmgE (transglycosylase-associated protein family)
MDLIPFLIALVVWGLIVGALARLALPGPDPIGILGTIAVGVVGSVLGGLLVALVTGDRQAGSGFFAAFVGAVLVLYVVRKMRGGGLMLQNSDAVQRRRRRGYR